MRVRFEKLVEKRLARWEAIRGKRTHVPGTTMALGRGDLPHDLVHLVAEAVAGLRHGFWGCVAEGGVFKSMAGKRSRHHRAIIAAHRDTLPRSEQLVFEHYEAWKRGQPTPAAEAFTRLDTVWRALGDGGSLTIAWPSLSLVDVDLGATGQRAVGSPARGVHTPPAEVQ